MEKEIKMLSTSDLMSTKNRLLLLIVQMSKSKKKDYVDIEELMEESLELFENDYKDEKVAKVRIKQMFEELNDERKISIRHNGNSLHIIPEVTLSDGTVSIQNVYLRATMILAIIVSWIIWVLSWIPPISWMIILTFISAMLITMSYFHYEKRFVINIKQKKEG